MDSHIESRQDNTGQTTLEDRLGNHPGTLSNFALNGSTSNWVGNPAQTNCDATILPELSISGGLVQEEGNSGTTNFSFTVTRTGSTAAGLSIFYEVVGTGLSPADDDDSPDIQKTNDGFPLFKNIPAGQSSFTLEIPVNGDTEVELDETFAVNLLAAPLFYTLGNNFSASANILNDDSDVGLVIALFHASNVGL